MLLMLAEGAKSGSEGEAFLLPDSFILFRVYMSSRLPCYCYKKSSTVFLFFSSSLFSLLSFLLAFVVAFTLSNPLLCRC